MGLPLDPWVARYRLVVALNQVAVAAHSLVPRLLVTARCWDRQDRLAYSVPLGTVPLRLLPTGPLLQVRRLESRFVLQDLSGRHLLLAIVNYRRSIGYLGCLR